MSASSTVAIDGRAISLARRHVLSAGKSALPPTGDRSRGASAPSANHVAAGAVPEASTLTVRDSAIAPSASLAVAHTNGHVRPSGGATSGREVSMARRQALSAGKTATRTATPVAPANESQARRTSAEPVISTVVHNGSMAGREQARMRRAEHSRRGRADALPAGPTRAPRSAATQPAPNAAVAPLSPSGGRVTGMRDNQTGHVTGNERGVTLPVSGTQYIGANSAAAWQAAGPKVGLTRTPGGALVSGTLMRGNVNVTGDEAGNAIVVTGEADQRFSDDVSARSGESRNTAEQFRRQTEPHGQAVYNNIGHSARSLGSRDRAGHIAIESTDGGLPITGSAIGHSIRVTGDEAGVCRTVTGDQYLAPAHRQALCGGPAPAAQMNAGRPDPVSGAKVSVAHTPAGNRVTGFNVNFHPNVTGSTSGARSAITGSSYEDRGTGYPVRDEAAGDETRYPPISPPVAAAVTGDTSLAGTLVTGSARGAARDITGTPYYREALPDTAAAAEPIGAIEARFSIQSPQRSAHLRARNEPAGEDAGRITGSFANGQGKLTGNLEFVFRSRRPATGNVAAHLALTGEGRATGRAITGEAWGTQKNVTGTEGEFAGARNPSERGGKPQAFAGSSRFKALASSEEPKHLVTGMFGYSSDSAAKVTLSGGAQG